jgi:uncharacterized protein YlxP (DUF503 family)
MPVHVSLLTVDLRLPEARSLKDKRQVLQSLLDRISARYRVSAAEVDRNDEHGRAQIAAACVGNSVAHCDEVLDKVLALIDAERRAEVVGVEREEL